MARDLHFHALQQGLFIPIAHTSYLGAARKPWRIIGNPLRPTTYLWMIQHDE